jgi:hypothetical protein
LLAGLGAATVLSSCELPGHKSGDPSLVDRRLWVDSRPDKHTDYVHAAIFLSESNVGVFQRASTYDLHLEIFEMTRDSKTMKVTFPQTGRSAGFTFAVRECDDLKPFDLCLTLSSNPWGGPTRYFAFSRPEDESRQLGGLARELRDAAQARRP